MGDAMMPVNRMFFQDGPFELKEQELRFRVRDVGFGYGYEL